MQLPVDIGALIDEMTDIDAARNTQIAFSVYVDAKAPAELAAHVRGMFASSSPNVRMELSYLDSSFAPREGDDLAVLVAGASRGIGAAASALRGMGVPVAVATLAADEVAGRAREVGYAIPADDIIAPDADVQDPASDADWEDGFDVRLGRWIATVCKEKGLAFAIAFPFVRRALARDAVQVTSAQNAAVGLVSLIPGADMPIMTLNQAKMVLQIAAAYGQDIMDKDRLKELAVVVGGAYLCRALARQLVEFVPVLGFLARAGVAYGGTAAVGYAAIDYFEGGTDASGAANVASQAANAASGAVRVIREDPGSIVRAAQDKAARGADVVRDAAARYVPAVRDAAAEYGPVVRDALAGAVATVRSR